MPDAICSLRDVRLDSPADGETLLDGVRFDVRAGEIFGVLSTARESADSVLRLVAGAIEPDGGRVEVSGRAPAGVDGSARPAIGVRLLPVRFMRHARVGELVEQFAGLYGAGPGDGGPSGGELAGFDPVRRAADAVEGLDAEETHLLSLVLATAHAPDLLVVEHPSSHLSPGARRAFWDRVVALNESGCTVVFSTPFPGETHLCHRVVILHGGRVRALDPPAELLSRFARGYVVEFGARGELDPEELRARPGVQRLEVAGGEVSIQVADLEGIRSLIELLESRGADVRDFRTRPARLHEIFLTLTRDDEEGESR